MARSETKTESTVTLGSRVETFNTMVSASGLLQLKTFLASPIKIQILRNAFVACPKTFTRNPKKKLFESSRWNCSGECQPTDEGRNRFLVLAFSGMQIQIHAKRYFSEELGEKVTNSLITNGKFFKPKTRQLAKNWNFHPDTNDFHHGGFRSAWEKFERGDWIWEMSRRYSKAVLMNSPVYYFRQPTPDFQHPPIKFKTP